MELKQASGISSCVTHRCERPSTTSIVRRDIIDGHAAVGSFEELVRELGHTRESAIARAKVHVGGPVVGEVLAEGAGCAGASGWHVQPCTHGQVEGILVIKAVSKAV